MHHRAAPSHSGPSISGPAEARPSSRCSRTLRLKPYVEPVAVAMTEAKRHVIERRLSAEQPIQKAIEERREDDLRFELSLLPEIRDCHADWRAEQPMLWSVEGASRDGRAVPF